MSTRTFTQDVISQRFAIFAKSSEGSSPLYSILSLQIAKDAELLELAAYSQAGQPPANMLFGAVQYCLREDHSDPLARYFATISGTVLAPESAFPYFKDFCHKHARKIMELLQTRRVQTNEVGRCSYLFPAFVVISDLVAENPIALVEVGASAGLNLNWDRYSYSYDNNGSSGSVNSSVLIHSKFRGSSKPRILRQTPSIHSRVGLELSVLDLADPEDARWLKSLVWPDQIARLQMLEAAIGIWQDFPQPLIEGDAVELLPKALAEIHKDVPIVIFHSHVTYQFSLKLLQEFEKLINTVGQQRTLFHLSAEWIKTSTPELWLTSYIQGQVQKQKLANVDQHGHWIEWSGVAS